MVCEQKRGHVRLPGTWCALGVLCAVLWVIPGTLEDTEASVPNPGILSALWGRIPMHRHVWESQLWPMVASAGRAGSHLAHLPVHPCLPHPERNLVIVSQPSPCIEQGLPETRLMDTWRELPEVQDV